MVRFILGFLTEGNWLLFHCPPDEALARTQIKARAPLAADPQQKSRFRRSGFG
jgi:hypothetical protein